MNLPSLISHLGIRQRVMILALVPITAITLVLSGYMISSRLSLERETLFKNSQTLLKYLAAGAEFGLFSENTEALAALAKAPQEQTQVSDIIFLNAQKVEIFRTGSTTQPLLSVITTNNQGEAYPFEKLWSLYSPVMVSGINVNDFSSEANAELEPPEPLQLGWVILLINDHAMKQRQQEILIRGLIITLIGLSVTLWMALSIGRSITGPIQAIIKTIDMLRHEQFQARVQVQSRGEIGELEKGINNLADRVQKTRLRLEDEVAQATHNLTETLHTLEHKNTALEQERQRAESANRAKDEFLARMSHELRTPLTSVMGFIKLLQKTSLDPDQREYSNVVRRTSSLLLRLIDDILDFSKLQSDAIKIERIPFDLLECVEDCLEMQAPSADDKGIELLLTCSPELPERLCGDPTRMRQIVANLIGNAVKFTEQGQVSIRLCCSVGEAETAVELHVKDTGVGIEQAKLSSLFQPFSQADTSITRRFGGSGLGLVITKRLTELMGGNIQLRSTVAGGTEATLSLVFANCPQPEHPINLNGRRILLFDRNPESASALQLCLNKWSAVVTPVHRPSQLLEQLYRQKPFDVVMLNVAKGQLNSRVLHYLTRKVGGCGHTKLILITATKEHFSPADTEAEQLHVASHHIIQRPVTHRKLLRELYTTHNPTLHDTARAPTQTLAGLNLLVAEDNNFNRLLLEKILEQTGAQLTLVSNGEQALAQASQQRFDCILMDVHMPLMDGIEASFLVRQLPSPLNDVPIIALTANVIANEEEKLKQAGIVATLFKPINETQIVQEIQRSAGRSTDHHGIENAQDKPRLSDYGISLSELRSELDTQINAILTAFASQDSLTMRDHAHQLTGLAGLLDLVELEAATVAFSSAVKKDQWRQIWRALWRLQRVSATLEI